MHLFSDPMIEEVLTVIRAASRAGRTRYPGPDGVGPIEVLKQLMWMLEANDTVVVIQDLIMQCWATGTVLQSWKDANIMLLFKKGIKTLCTNNRENDIDHFAHRQDSAEDSAHLELC